MENENEIMRTLGKIEANQDAILEILKERKRKMEKIEERIDALEKSKAWVMGAATVAGAAMSFLINSLLGKQ